MFSFLKKDPSKKLKQQYAKLLEQAMLAQRNGDIRGYGMLTREAEEINQQIQELEAGKAWFSKPKH